MSTVIITVGISASGKSTWARENASDLNAVIVCRDDIRIAQNLPFGADEDKVTKIQYAQIEAALLSGMNVISADTNIDKRIRGKLIKFAHQHGADVEIVAFHIPVGVAILRDAPRGTASVGPDVIAKQYSRLSGQQVMSESLPVKTYSQYEHGSTDYLLPAIVVDIDGTVARNVSRSPYDESKVLEDEYVDDVCDIVNDLSRFYRLVFVSGRKDSCESDTRTWLNRRFAGYDLFMRKASDSRPDWVIKNEIYDEHVIPRYNVYMVFDDRDQVVKHLRRRGITVAQMAEGRF